MGLAEKVTHRNNIIPTSVLVAAVLPPAHGILFALQQIYYSATILSYVLS